MRSTLLVLVASAALLAAPALAAPATICDGNATLATADGLISAGEYSGSSSGVGGDFGQVLGATTRLLLDSNSSGQLVLGLESGTSCTQSGNDSIVLYLDSRPGGFNTTSGFTDNGDPGRAAASGMGTDGARAALTFAPSFAADFAVVIQSGFAGVFELRAGGPHVFVRSLTAAANAGPPCAREWAGLSLADLGAQVGADLRYVATLLNANNAYRSNEFHGLTPAPGTIGIAPFGPLAAGSWVSFRAGPGESTLPRQVHFTFETYTGGGFAPVAPCGQLSSDLWSMTGMSDGPLPFGAQGDAGTDFGRGLTDGGGVTTGGTYAFVVAAGNRALGVQPGGTDFAPGTLTLRLRNTSAATLTSADVSYSLWVRNDQGRANSWSFSWGVDGGAFTHVPALDYLSPAAADALGFVQNTRATALSGFEVPPDGYLYLRFTGADDAGAGSRDEFALDDLIVSTPDTDYGDAPASYGVAAHRASNLTLGALLDTEAANQPSALSDADDLAGVDDEDGVSFGAFRTGATTMLGVTSNGPGRVSAWVDWNRDGVFQSTEQALSNEAVSAGSFMLSIPVPLTAAFGASVLRVRLASTNPISPTGTMSDGEVEDYAITITGCGDGAVNGGEACDSGGVSTTECGCQASCTFRPSGTSCNGAPSGACDEQDTCDGAGACVALFQPSTTVCRTSAGACDVAESCTGSSATCPADGFASSGECRAANGACDVAESCDGSGPNCPVDGFVAAATVCRGAMGLCDVAEACTGSSPACPPDVLASAGVTCRGAADVCDVAEACTGLSPACPADGFASAMTTCRGSAGACDVPESCTGSSAACPADTLVSAGTQCRAANGVCDVAETCSGSSALCPNDGFASSGVCRPANGLCDVAESCNGSGAACPADGFAPASTTCRASAGPCDVAEQCTGLAPACPADGFASSGVCRPANGLCDVAESCNGSGAACPADGFAPSSTTCRASAGPCDVAEQCTGSAAACPTDAFAASGVCRPATGTCDVAESCDGSGAACPANAFAPAATTCRAASGACDVAESCTGSSDVCPADALAPSTTVCRPVAGACDLPEACDGVTAACPADAVSPNGTTCRASTGTCDLTESCNGVDPACPADAFAPATTVCRVAVGVCDVAERCTGSSGACPGDVFAMSGVCRPASGACDVAESCDGTTTSCPADQLAPNGTACRDSLTCNGDEVCQSGACVAGTPPTCEDNNACTLDVCAEPSGCSNMRIPGCCLTAADCDDLDACTTDACPGAGQMCTHLPVPGCVDGGVDGGELDGGERDGGEADAGLVDAGTADDAGMGGGVAGGGSAGGGSAGGGTAGGAMVAGGAATMDAGTGTGPEMPGCNCSAVDPAAAVAFAMFALALRGRRRR